MIIVSGEKYKPRLMDQLAEKPISVQGWVKPSRDEIHERKSLIIKQYLLIVNEPKIQ